MLILSRRDAESILIRPGDGIDPATTLGDLFKGGPIEIIIFSSNYNRVKMGVQAPDKLPIWRKNGVAAKGESLSRWIELARARNAQRLRDRFGRIQ